VYSFRRNRNKLFLGLSLFFVWYSLFVIILTITKEILNYPEFHRTGIVSAYLAFPFLYIYTRNTFYPGRFWRKTDWILLIPAIIYIIDFAPFFLTSSQDKISILRENLANNTRMFTAGEGWMGLTGVYFPFAYIWIAIIVYFQVRVLLQNLKMKNGFTSRHNRRTFSFVVTITLLYLPLFLPGVFGVLLRLSWFNTNFIGLTFGLSLSAISIYLFISPDILYGFIPEKKFSTRTAMESPALNDAVSIANENKQLKNDVQVSAEEIKIKTEMEEAAKEMEAEVEIVQKQMREEKPFLKQGFTIQDLSNQTGIPVYQLSPIINRYFKMNFANWINRYRIEYLVEQVPNNPQLTLEAISRQAGFISRSTFINAFKKEKGITPREYFKGLKFSS
jgi:AraC-like DNA-binding protein